VLSKTPKNNILSVDFESRDCYSAPARMLINAGRFGFLENEGDDF